MGKEWFVVQEANAQWITMAGPFTEVGKADAECLRLMEEDPFGTYLVADAKPPGASVPLSEEPCCGDGATVV